MNRKKYERIVLVAFFIMLFVAATPISSSAKTYYTNKGVTNGLMSYPTRTKVTSSLESKTSTNTKEKKVGGLDNTSSKTSTNMTVNYTASKSRTYSFSATSDVPLNCLKSDVKVTLGGSISFAESISLSVSQKVPAKKKGEVYLYYEKESAKFKYVCQKQQKNISGVWCNKGSAYTKYGTITTKVPWLKPIIKK